MEEENIFTRLREPEEDRKLKEQFRDNLIPEKEEVLDNIEI